MTIQSEVKPNVIGPSTLSRASRRLLEHVSAWRFDWLSGLSGSESCDEPDYFGFALSFTIIEILLPSHQFASVRRSSEELR